MQWCQHELVELGMTPQHEPALADPDSGLRIESARVQDLRAIRHLCMPLADVTVLVGENNVGKSTLLRALDIVLGGCRPVDEDLHVSEDGTRSAEFIVDLKIVPWRGDEFDDALAGRFGQAIRLPLDEPQFVVIRTVCRPGSDGMGPSVEQRYLERWTCDRAEAAESALLPERPSRDQLQLLSFFLLDARRDLVDELRHRYSYWGRLLSDVGIHDEDREDLETKLQDVGAEVVAKSDVLNDLREELERVREALGSAVSGVTIEALPARIEEVARSVDVLLRAPDSAALPLRLQGMGSRSLAAVMVFQAFARLRLGADQDVRPLPISGFEEPEAHLHPHAQRAMFEIIRQLPGQKIVSTHSPHVVQVADLFDLRVLTRSGATIDCRFIPSIKPDGTATFSPEGLAKARRFVQRNNGEVLFARCVVLYEGDTEDGALPTFARARWDLDPSAHGVSMVETQGAGNMKHFVRVLDSLGIPWVVLVDGDPAGTDAIAGIETELGRPMTADEHFVLPGGVGFEQYLIAQGFEPEIRSAIARLHGATALDDYKTSLDGQKGKGGTTRDYHSAGWQTRLLADYCHEWTRNALGGAAIAEDIIVAVDNGVQTSIPDVIEALLTRVDTVIGVGP
jgi:putative ATP-dependent endonuclease of the OLD family